MRKIILLITALLMANAFASVTIIKSGYEGNYGSCKDNSSGTSVNVTCSAASGCVISGGQLNGGGSSLRSWDGLTSNSYTFTYSGSYSSYQLMVFASCGSSAASSSSTSKSSASESPTYYSLAVSKTGSGSVTFKNGSSAISSAVSGTSVSVTASPSNGYELTSISSNNVSLSGSGNTRTFTMPSNKVTVNVTFSAISYGITYYVDGEISTTTGNSATYNVESSFSLVNPTSKNGYTFSGWYADEACEGDKVTGVAKGSTGAKEFYGKWVPEEYGITYKVDGEVTTETGNLAKYTIESENFSLVDPSPRNGYTFSGWYTDEACEGDKVTRVSKGSTGVKVFYGKWVPEEYDITYKVDGKVITETSNPAKYTVETESFELDLPTKWGYKFDGWYADEACEGDKVTEVVKGSAGSKIFHGKWIKTIELVDDCYEIFEVEGLYEFASIVNNFSGEDASKICGKLENDITLNEKVLGDDGCMINNNCVSWTPIGKYENPFRGSFDGQGHVVKGLYFNDEIAFNVGLFGLVRGSEESSVSISNLGVEDAYIRGCDYIGGIGGHVSSAIFTNVYNTGSINGDDEVGGLVGLASDVKIVNSYSTAGIQADGWQGGLVGKAYNTITFVNCFSLTAATYGSYFAKGVVIATEDDFKNGLVAISLHVGADGSKWGQDNSNANPEKRNQYPTFTSVQPTVDAVVFNVNGGYLGKDAAIAYASIDDYYTLPGAFKNGFGFQGWYDNAELDGDALTESDLLARIKDGSGIIDLYAKWHLMEITDGCYVIKDAEDFYSFASIVNNFMGEDDSKICGKLENDITLNDKVLGDDGCMANNNCVSWTPIGTSRSQFAGSFNGQGHVVKGLYFNDENVFYAGLFGYIDGSEGSPVLISNLGVEDSYVKGDNSVGGIAGFAHRFIFTNVYNTGSVNGDDDVGGLIGVAQYGKFVNSYSVGEIHSNDWQGRLVSRIYNITFVNCYSLAIPVHNCGSVDGVTVVSENDFKNGLVALGLRGGEEASVWGQNAGHEDHPNFSGVTKFDVAFETNGGKIVGDAPKTYVFGTVAKLPKVSNDDKYLFKGWYTNDKFTGSAIEQIDAETKLTPDENGKTVFYAKWVVKAFKISFVDEDGKTELGPTLYYDYGTLPENIDTPEPTKDSDEKFSYTFDGWDKDIVVVTETATYTATYAKVALDASSSSSSSENTASSSSKTDAKSSSSSEKSSSSAAKPASSSSSEKPASSSSKKTEVIVATAVAPQFNLYVVGRNVQIVGARVGSAFAVLDMQGRVMNSGRVASANFSVAMPRSGNYMVRVGGQVQKVNVK